MWWERYIVQIENECFKQRWSPRYAIEANVNIIIIIIIITTTTTTTTTNNNNNNSVALVRERTIPTERPSLVGIMPTFADRVVSRGQHGGSLRP
jgi:hypothetical protein